MTLVERIQSDTTAAMKARNESALSALRLAVTALKNKQIDLGHPLTDDEARQVIKTMVKQYGDALADFEKAGRADLATKQKAEIELLNAYLPAQMSEAEIEPIAKKIIADLGATQKDGGRVMGAIMKEIAGRADGNAVKAVVSKLLQ